MILDRVFGLVEDRIKVMTGYGLQEDATLKAVFGERGRTMAGVEVTEETSLGLSAFYDGVKLLAWTRAQLPLNVYRGERFEDHAVDERHPVHRLIHTRPNPDMTSMVYRELEMTYVLLWGDSISYIEKNAAGLPVALWPMHPGQITVGRWDGSRAISYDLRNLRDPPTTDKVLRQDQVLHTPGFGFDGLRGKSVIRYAAEQMGEALAAQQFGAGFYGNGAKPGMVIRHPGKIKNVQAFKDNWEAIHKGPQNAGRVAVLEDNADVKEIGMPLEDAQFIESREFHVAEVARWLGLPPHKLGDLRRATFSNIAEQNIEFVQAVRPWLVRFEQEYDFKLFNESEQDAFFIAHDVDDLLEADPEKQSNAFATALQNGWMSRNEVRRRKHLNAIGEQGDQYTVQVNLTPLDQLEEVVAAKAQPPEPPMPPAPPAADEDEPPMRTAARLSLSDAMARLVHKESREAETAAKSPSTFLAWLERFYGTFPAKMAEHLIPAVQACRAAGVDLAPATLAAEHCQVAKAALLDLSGTVKAAELEERVRAEVGQWRATITKAIEEIFNGD